MTNKILVIAGNYQEYYHGIVQNVRFPMDFEYVSDTIKLFGRHRPRVVLIGTYPLRKDWNKLELQLKLIDAEIINDNYTH